VLLERPIEAAAELVQVRVDRRCVAQMVELRPNVRVTDRESPRLLPGHLVDGVDNGHTIVGLPVVTQDRLVYRMEHDLLIELSRGGEQVQSRVQVTNHALGQIWLIRGAQLREKSHSFWVVLGEERRSDVQIVFARFFIDPRRELTANFAHFIISVRLNCAIIVGDQCEAPRIFEESRLWDRRWVLNHLWVRQRNLYVASLGH